MTRTTRTGTVFSPYTLGTPFLCDVDAEDLLRRRFAELDAMDDLDAEEREEELESEDEDADAHESAHSPLVCFILAGYFAY